MDRQEEGEYASGAFQVSGETRAVAYGNNPTMDGADLLLTFFHEGPHVSQYLPVFFRQHERDKGRHRRAFAAIL